MKALGTVEKIESPLSTALLQREAALIRSWRYYKRGAGGRRVGPSAARR
jgi:hypothetical protein